MNIPSQKNRKRSIDIQYIQYIQFRSFPCFPDLHFERLYKKGRCTGTKKRAYGRCSRREIKGNEISTEPVLHNGSQPCHIPGANICLNGVEPFGKTLTFLRKKGGKLDDDVPYSFFHWRQAPFGCFAPCQEKCILSPSCNNLCSALLSPFFAIPH